jgi:thiol-disulfide isomerase/thioredoxin
LFIVTRLLSTVVGLISALALGSPAMASGFKGESVGTLQFEDANGRSIKLDEPGVVYLVDFWALGCKPCMMEMPDLDRLAKECEPSGHFRLVSVVWGGWKGDRLLQVADDAGTTEEVYSDPENWHDRLGVDAFPTKLLIRDGTVIVRKRGGGAGSYDYWKSAIERELKAAPAVR